MRHTFVLLMYVDHQSSICSHVGVPRLCTCSTKPQLRTMRSLMPRNIAGVYGCLDVTLNGHGEKHRNLVYVHIYVTVAGVLSNNLYSHLPLVACVHSPPSWPVRVIEQKTYSQSLVQCQVSAASRISHCQEWMASTTPCSA